MRPSGIASWGGRDVAAWMLAGLWMLVPFASAQESRPDTEASPGPEPSRPAADGGEPDTYQQAVAQAKARGRYLLVAVYADGCDQCPEFDETLADREVQEWIDTRAVLLKLDTAETIGANFASAHRVESFPTVVVMSSDEREIGRQIGFAKPKRFLIKLNAVIQGDAVRGKPGVRSWAGEDVVLATMAEAAKLTAEAEYDKALEKYLWCYEHRAIRSPLFMVVHLGELVNGWAKLGDKHPPARRALLDALAKQRGETLSTGRTNVFALYFIKNAHKALDMEQASIEHYDVLKRRWPDSVSVRAFARLIFQPLLEARRYEELRFAVADPGDAVQFFDEARELRRDPQEVRRLMGARYEILLGVGEKREAQKLTEMVLAFDNAGETYLALAEAAVRAGVATEETLNHAHLANDLLRGESSRAVCALASLMAIQKPRNPQAISLLKAAVLRFRESPADKAAVEQCMRDIQTGKIGGAVQDRAAKPRASRTP